MSIKRTITATIVGLTLVALVAPVTASAVTVEDLLAQIAQLQAQLNALIAQQGGGTPSGTVPAACVGVTFTRSLTVGSTGSDVKCTQALLNNNGFVLATSGVGSPGNETSYFGPLTLTAVKSFQASKGWTPANQVGPLTRQAFNALLSGGTPGPGPGPTPGPTPLPAPAGALSVMLASDTPASSTIADETNANFTKFSLTAGSGDVSITKIYVTRSGLSLNSDVENIKIIEVATGAYKGTTASLNADNRAVITFTPALVIPANTTKAYFIRAGVINGIAAGKTVVLGIAANTDIVSNATSVSGAPVTGNAMSAVILTVGSLSVAEDGTTVDTTPDAGDTDVTVNQFKFTAGSAEAVTIETITALKAGTADSSDTANIELFDVTHNKTLATVASWDSEEKVTWSDLNLVLEKGASIRLKIMVDIVGGVESTAQTVNADIVDGSDTLVTARGNSYGFYLTVSEGSYSGKGTNNQTINSGSLNISKSSSTPATGNISAGDDVVLGVFDFDVKGEEVRITSILVEAVLGTMTYDQVTLVKIYDENGTIVAGPQDLASGATATFTDTIIVPVGLNKYTIKAKIADAVSTGDTIVIDIGTPTASITAKGMTSGDTIAPTPAADVSANTLTVAAGAMVATTLTTPIAQSVPKGVSDFIWATGSLSATNSGENVLASSLSVLDTTSSAADADDIDNMELWADLTSANSTRGDAYETKISRTENPSGNAVAADVTQAFTLTQTITIAKGSYVNVALIADLNASAVGTVDTDTHTFSFSAGTFTGAQSGQDISETASGSGQAMTITTAGTLTISADSSTPVADIVLSGQEASLFVLRLAANNVENLDVDDITFMVTGGASVASYRLYNGSTQIGVATSGTAPKFVFADGTVTVPKNSYVRLALKGTFVDTGSTTNNTTITAGIEGDNLADSVNCTGLASGNEVDSDANSANGNGQDLYKTKPTFAAASTWQGQTLSGTLVPNSAGLIAVFNVTADANEDVTFEASSGGLIFNIDQSVNDSDGTANTWTLKDQDGNTLDTGTVAENTTSPTLTFDFASSQFTVPAGETKSLLLYGNTSEMEDDGDSVQVSLQATAGNITWSINNDGGTYADGDKIFRGTIYAGSWVNPS